jgi:FMN phosphatase YigB (HAD superfamily)
MSDRLIVLDVHGVVFTNPLVPFIADLAERTGRDRKEAVATWHGRLRRRFWLGQLSVVELWQEFAPGADAEALTAELEGRYETGPLFDWVAHSDGPIWLLSNHRSDWLQARLARFGLGSRFERVYVSDAIGRVKPEFEAFRYAQDQAGGREITYVDDKPGNVAAAGAVFATAMTVGDALKTLVAGEPAGGQDPAGLAARG